MGGTNGPDVTESESNLPATDTHGTEMNWVDTPPAAEFPFSRGPTRPCYKDKEREAWQVELLYVPGRS